MTYRVLYRAQDQEDGGLWADVQASNPVEAAWQAGQQAPPGAILVSAAELLQAPPAPADAARGDGG